MRSFCPWARPKTGRNTLKQAEAASQQQRGVLAAAQAWTQATEDAGRLSESRATLLFGELKNSKRKRDESGELVRAERTSVTGTVAARL